MARKAALRKKEEWHTFSFIVGRCVIMLSQVANPLVVLWTPSLCVNFLCILQVLLGDWSIQVTWSICSRISPDIVNCGPPALVLCGTTIVLLLFLTLRRSLRVAANKEALIGEHGTAWYGRYGTTTMVPPPSV